MATSAQNATHPGAAAADTDIVRRPEQRARHVERFGPVFRPSMSATGRPVVLLVQQLRDDGLDMYAEYLHHAGLAAIAVSNVEDALAFAPEADVIVTGIVLDDIVDGVELVSRLRGAKGTMHKPIIVLTACALRWERERAEHAGCDLFLSKPCLPDALLREVRLLLSTMHDTVGSLPQQ